MTANVAVITGAAGGMGRIACSRLSSQGWKVAAVDLPSEALDAVSGETAAIPYPCDVADAEAVERTADTIAAELGPVRRLVNAAGIAVPGLISEVPAATFAHAMNVNYLGTAYWVKALLPGMLERRTGELALLASFAAWMPVSRMGAYTATKFAVTGFAETLAMELRGSGVAVRCVCPPAVQTPMLDDIYAQGLPTRMQRFARPITAEQVIDALEKSLEKKPTAQTMVFPDASTKVMWRIRRWTPRLLNGVVNVLTG